jgi:hypothetical protein
MRSDIEAGLSDSECEQLHRIASILIPPSEEFGVPGAGDPVIFADVVKSIGRDLADVRTALVHLEGQSADAILDTVSSASDGVMVTLGRVILQCYYRDDRVLLSIGVEPRPPFPKGHVLEQGDWSLLDVVKQRKPFWRDDRAA